jgi:response regulator RpfG family c-di-GMP phosphodiesterase/DNA-binding CsgD family transcriptional regulator
VGTGENATARDVSSGVELAEIVASIALAADLSIGQSLDHVLRSCVIATRFAEHLGLAQVERDSTYWVTLFMVAGCSGTSFELSSVVGDDISFRAEMFGLTNNFEFLRHVLGRVGSGRGLVARTKMRADLLRTRMRALEEAFLAHCLVSQRLAERVGLGSPVTDALAQTFARYDGKGIPKGLGGENILPAIAIAEIAHDSAWHVNHGGPDATIEAARKFSGTFYSPALVDAWCDAAGEVLAGISEESTWDQVISSQPLGRGPLTEAELDDALELIADFADLKSPWFAGHSRGVASLAVEAGRVAGLSEPDLVTLHRAALVHDIGRNGIPNSIWDKPGPLTDGEMERVRLHAYYTDRVLRRSDRLAALAGVASAAHERTNGNGYPRGIGGQTIPLLGRFLEPADVYQAMLEDRPHRPARSRDEAAAELRRAAIAGEMDGGAVDAVLAAAGHRTRRKPAAPAGLTPREQEVLVLAARGGTTRAVASKLGIAPKTAGNHLERIYAKIGVSSRAEAAMYAMQHGLVPTWDTAEL